MQNKWKKAGCMRRLPYSQSCQPRNVAWMRSPAASCVSPAASRAAFTCTGVGLLAALPARLRLGWLGIFNNYANLNITKHDFIAIKNESIIDCIRCVFNVIWICRSVEFFAQNCVESIVVIFRAVERVVIRCKHFLISCPCSRGAVLVEPTIHIVYVLLFFEV